MNIFEGLVTPIVEAIPGLDPGDLVFSPAPKLDLGDVALRTFEAARRLGVKPAELGARIASEVRFGGEVLSATAAGPYVNFRLDRGRFGAAIASRILSEGARFGSNDTGRGKKAVVEHSSINPNASPHVGRARGALIGDSVVRLLRFEGYEVEVHYYVNDIGRQIALLVLACEDPAAMTFDDMLTTYARANARAEADPAFAEQGYELLARIEEGEPEAQARFFFVTEMCLRGQLAVLARLGISFDVFERESRFVKDPRLDAVVEALRAKGALFVDEEKRLTVDLAKLGHTLEEGRYFPLLRSNGSSMYGYRDLAYTMFKMERAADVNWIVLGEDHKLHMQQVTRILAAAGQGAPEPIHYSYVLLKEGKMSTRQGTVVLLSDFLDKAVSLSRERVEEQWQDLPPAERESIATQVATSAVRFTILRVNPNKNVIFDWDSSLSFTGDTGPYIQYSSARISSILRKFGEVRESPANEFPVETDAEWALLTKLAAFPDTVAAALAERNCAPIAQFALETARLFTAFYHECPVLDAPRPAQKVARAQICAATRQTIANALGILGIEALERM